MEKKKVKSLKTVKKPKAELGRPTIMTENTLALLKHAFNIGCSDREACLYADISMATLYNYQEKYPQYVQQKELWKEHPILQARTTVIDNIVRGNNGDLALRFLERKKKDEFAPKSSIDIGITKDLDEKLEAMKNFIFPETTE